MEMVKVDIQKLQLLNDRIAQTLEALDQVRLSVHGIQHTGPTSPWTTGAYGGYPMPHVVPGFAPAFTPGFGSPYAAFANPYQTAFSPFAGIQHSSFSPYGNPYASRASLGIPFAPYAQSPYASYSNGASPVAWVNGGLSHTPAFDPAWQQRLAWDPMYRTQTITPTLGAYPVPLS